MLSLDRLFSESAVLQRGKEISVWGLGDDGAEVTVSIQGLSTKAVVRLGKWVAKLPPLVASESEMLSVSDGKTSITVRNVAVGEVWIAGGQSNMEFPMRNLREYNQINKTNIPSIRLYGVPRISYDGQLEDDDFSEYRIWRPCAPEHFWFYSAAPFYFAVKLYEKYNVPVGILNCNYGGTRASSWADLELLKQTGAKVWIDEYEAAIKDLDIEAYTRSFRKNPMFKMQMQDHSPMRDKMWKGYSEYEMIYAKPRMERMFKNMPIPVVGPLDSNRPAALYEHMIKQIAPYGVRGAIWYQGEADDTHPEVYDEAMSAVIDSWRRIWNDDFPFLMVQLAPFERFFQFPAMHYVELRDMQDKVAKTKKDVYVTNVMDAGMRYDIHPKAKKPVGERLALLAMGKVYGEPIVCEAPEVSSIEHCGDQVVITFKNCGEGLARAKSDEDALNVLVNGKQVKDATMRVGKSMMTLKSAAFKKGRQITVKYGRKNFCLCNVKNSAGIPVKPFEVSIKA